MRNRDVATRLIWMCKYDFKKDDKDCLKTILILQGPNQESYRAVRDSRTLRSPDSNEDREFVQETTEIKI